jgi:hypothetical protein
MAARDLQVEGIVADRLGRPLFHCHICHRPITRLDFAKLCLRLPDPDETADEYRDAELIDQIAHFDCTVSSQAAG